MAANPTIRLGNDFPAAPAGYTNVVWQSADSPGVSGQVDVSAYYQAGSGGALFTFDGDSLTGWTVGSGTVTAGQATSGFSPLDFNKACYVDSSDSYAYTELAFSLAGCIVEFDIAAVNSSTTLCDLVFGADSSGNGQNFRLDGRGGVDLSGIATCSSWAGMGAPSHGIALTKGTWYHVKLVFNTAGTQVTWFVNGAVQGQTAVTLRGNYIGIDGDGGSDGGYFANLRIYQS